MRKKFLCLWGLLFWLVAAAATGFAFRTGPLANPQSPSLLQYLTRPTVTTLGEDPTGTLVAGDPVFARRGDDTWQQIGSVSRRLDEPGDQIAIGWFGHKAAAGSYQLTMYQNDGSLASILATLLPPEKIKQIQQHIAAAMRRHGEELTAQFVPLVEQSLTRSLPLIEQEVRRSMARHQDEVDALSARWHHQIVQERMIPLARRELLPIVRRHAGPIATDIGRQLWDRASIWSFGWRLAYDRLPLTEQNLTQQEWDRFVQVEAIPVIEDHVDEMIDAVQEIISAAVDNQVVRQELAQAARDLAADPETRRLAAVILKESLVGNEQLRQAWSEIWTGEQARRALDLAGVRLEPLAREIGDELFGTQQEGINPDFARVLRNQILGKDRRWLVATEHSGLVEQPVVKIQPSTELMPYPVVHLAGGEN